MTDDRTFTDAEVREILEEAADRQAAADKALVHTRPGMSLAELEQIAQEAGIAPEHVRAAALRGNDGSSVPALSRDPSGKLSIDSTRLIPGRVADEAWGRIVTELRSTFKVVGSTSEFGQTREWLSVAATGAMEPVSVTLEREGDGTRMRLHQAMKQRRQLAYILPGAFVALGLVLGLLIAVTGGGDKSPWPLVAIFTGLGTVGGIVGPLSLKAWVGSQRKKFDHMMDRAQLLAAADPDTWDEED